VRLVKSNKNLKEDNHNIFLTEMSAPVGNEPIGNAIITPHEYMDCPNPEECDNCIYPWETVARDHWKKQYKDYELKVLKHNIRPNLPKHAILTLMTFDEWADNQIKFHERLEEGHREWLKRSKNHLDSYNEWREDMKKNR
jgi:hypothetical protein